MVKARSFKGISAKERTDILKSELDDLARSIITDPKRLHDFSMSWRKGFHSYSFYNTFMILLQNPKAQLCAGQKTWNKKHNRTLKDGQYYNAIWVLAPAFRKEKVRFFVKDENGVRVQNGDGTDKTEIKLVDKIAFFMSVPIYDVNQTEGEDLDMGMNQSKFEGKEFSVQDVFKFFPEYDFSMVQSVSDGSTNGQDVRVAVRKNKAQEVASSFHEIAHAMLGHCKNNGTKTGQALSRDRAELEAEAVSYLVCSCVGIEHKEGASLYLGNWKGDTEKLERSSYRVLKVAGKIVKRIAEGLEVK